MQCRGAPCARRTPHLHSLLSPPFPGLGRGVPTPRRGTAPSSARPRQASPASRGAGWGLPEGGRLRGEGWPGKPRATLSAPSPGSGLAPAGISFTIPDGPAPDFLFCFQDQLCFNLVIFSRRRGRWWSLLLGVTCKEGKGMTTFYFSDTQSNKYQRIYSRAMIPLALQWRHPFVSKAGMRCSPPAKARKATAVTAALAPSLGCARQERAPLAQTKWRDTTSWRNSAKGTALLTSALASSANIFSQPWLMGFRLREH